MKKVYFLITLLAISILGVAMVSAFWPFTGNAVKTTTCTETDGGKDIYTLGTANGKQDVCAGITLTEYYCADNKVRSMKKVCGVGCANGACIKPCEDSDLGIVPEIGGVVTLRTKNVEGIGEAVTGDYCRDSSTLLEVYCKNIRTNNFWKTVDIKCKDTCTKETIVYNSRNVSVSKCKPLLRCEDSDGGKNLNTKGTVTAYDENGNAVQNISEFCADDNHVVEMGCSLRTCEMGSDWVNTASEYGSYYTALGLKVPPKVIQDLFDGLGFGEDKSCSWAFAPASSIYDRVHLNVKKCKEGCFNGACQGELNATVQGTIEGLQFGESSIED